MTTPYLLSNAAPRLRAHLEQVVRYYNACCSDAAQFAMTQNWLIFLIGIVMCCPAIANQYDFEYRIEAVGPTNADTAKLRFSLLNSGKTEARILTWNTPLVGSLASRVLKVECYQNGASEELRYQGALRKEPSSSEQSLPYPSEKQQNAELLKSAVRLKSGEMRENVFDLASAYQLPKNKDCRVTFEGLITVLSDDALGVQYEFARPRGAPLSIHVDG